MALPGETEAGSAGKQPCRGIVRRAHRDDDHGRGNERLAPTLHPIGSKDPDALKIPARRAASTRTRSALSPVPAEPAHLSFVRDLEGRSYVGCGLFKFYGIRFCLCLEEEGLPGSMAKQPGDDLFGAIEMLPHPAGISLDVDGRPSQTLSFLW